MDATKKCWTKLSTVSNENQLELDNLEKMTEPTELRLTIEAAREMIEQGNQVKAVNQLLKEKKEGALVWKTKKTKSHVLLQKMTLTFAVCKRLILKMIIRTVFYHSKASY